MHVFLAAVEAMRAGIPAALATVILAGGSTPRSAGARMLVRNDGTTVGTIGGGAVEYRVVAEALESIESGRPRRFEAHLTRDLGMCCGGRMEVYIEPLAPRERVVIFGAGHVARALAPVLLSLEYEVVVVDERDEFATPERFPGCDVRCTDPRAFAEALPGGPLEHWFVTTHDHQLDQDLCEILLPRECAWIGLIASRAKVARFLVRYRAAGLDEALFRKLSSPVGLDIGAETASEIAVSIAAELVRVRRRSQRPPQPLSELPLAARGGDGKAQAPALSVTTAETVSSTSAAEDDPS